MKKLVLILLMLAYATPAWAQFGRIMKGAERVQKARDIVFTDDEEQELGAAVSERIRARYGVVQDAAVHRYVTLVGSLLGQASSRPKLTYRIIVLDTDGVNAFAAPGGFIHVTRGTLALVANEAELAGVLAHEIAHVTERHTVKALQRSRTVGMATSESAGGGVKGYVVSQFADKAFDAVYAGFDRGDELDADKVGVALANKVGYDPKGLGAFLTRLAERNKATKDTATKQGLFASHPEMQERLDKTTKQLAADRLTGTVALADRYRTFVKYEPKPIDQLTVVESGAAGLTGGAPADEKSGDTSAKTAEKEEPKKKKRGFGLGNLVAPKSSEEKKSAQVTGSGGSRGVDKERLAKGGDNPALVAVKISQADVDQFRKEGGLKA
jgi:predicted Zn-dependent protease